MAILTETEKQQRANRAAEDAASATPRKISGDFFEKKISAKFFDEKTGLEVLVDDSGHDSLLEKRRRAVLPSPTFSSEPDSDDLQKGKKQNERQSKLSKRAGARGRAPKQNKRGGDARGAPVKVEDEIVKTAIGGINSGIRRTEVVGDSVLEKEKKEVVKSEIIKTAISGPRPGIHRSEGAEVDSVLEIEIQQTVETPKTQQTSQQTGEKREEKPKPDERPEIKDEIIKQAPKGRAEQSEQNSSMNSNFSANSELEKKADVGMQASEDLLGDGGVGEVQDGDQNELPPPPATITDSSMNSGATFGNFLTGDYGALSFLFGCFVGYWVCRYFKRSEGYNRLCGKGNGREDGLENYDPYDNTELLLRGELGEGIRGNIGNVTGDDYEYENDNYQLTGVEVHLDEFVDVPAHN